MIESLNDWKINLSILLSNCRVRYLFTFLIGVPVWTRDAFWAWPSCNEFKLSLDCPFAIDLSTGKQILIRDSHLNIVNEPLDGTVGGGILGLWIFTGFNCGISPAGGRTSFAPAIQIIQWSQLNFARAQSKLFTSTHPNWCFAWLNRCSVIACD